MKKFIALVLAMTMVFSMAVVASAASTTTLTTTVPAANYTMTIPANQEVAFGTTSQKIGMVKITESSSFAEGKNIRVTFENTDFTCPNTTTTIPVAVYGCYSELSYTSSPPQSVAKTASIKDSTIIFEGLSSGTVSSEAKAEMNGETRTITNLGISMSSPAWGKALAGEYTATITFSSEVVVE